MRNNPGDRRPRTVLVPLLNLTVAPDLLSLAAGMVAGAEPFPPQRARVLVLAVVAVPAGHSPAEAQTMARGYRAMLGYLPNTITPPGRAGAPAAASDPPPPAIPVHTLIKVAPSLDQGIREAVTSENADLLLLHWKGYANNADRHVFGSTLDELLQRPPCNLLLARAGHWQEAERILLPLRGGPNAELALDVGLQLAGRLGIGLTVLHGVPRAVPTAESRRGGDAPYLALQERLAGAPQGGLVEQVFTLDTDVPAGVARHVLESDLVILGAAGSPNAPLVRNALLSSVLADPARPILMARAVQPLDLAAYREGLRAGIEGAISAERWFVENTYHQDEFADTARWLAARRHRQAHISVVLPTRNDAPRIVQTLVGLRRALQGSPGAEIADEILVVDAASGDETASLAAGQGVPVRRVTGDAATREPGVPGPAALLREALNLAGGDILVWLDPKAGKLRPSYVPALVGPLLHDSGLLLVKPFFTPARPGEPGPAPGESPDARFAPIAIADLLAWSLPELAAVPLYNWVRAFYPRLGAVMNPLGGVFAARRSLLRDLLPTLEANEATAQGDGKQAPAFSPRLAFAAGLLLETAAAYSPRAIAQVEVQSSTGGHAGRRVANPDLRQLREIGELLALFATRPDAALHQATIQQLRTRILHASA